MSTESGQRASIIFPNHLQARLLLLTLAAGTALHAERAILECVADGWAARDGRFHGATATLEAGAGKSASMDFRISLIAGWRISKATLLLHVASGKAPDRLGAGVAVAAWRESDARMARAPSGRTAPVTSMEQGWIGAEIDAALVQEMADGKAHGLRIASNGAVAFHARESLGTAPYLIVEGERR